MEAGELGFVNYKQKTFLMRKPKLGDKEMVKIIKAEIQKWVGVEVEQKDGPCAIRKKKGKKNAWSQSSCA